MITLSDALITSSVTPSYHAGRKRRDQRGVSFPSLKTLENLSHALNVPLKSFFDFDEEKSKDQAFERELSKLSIFLRTLRKKDINLIHEILKFTFKKLK